MYSVGLTRRQRAEPNSVGGQSEITAPYSTVSCQRPPRVCWPCLCGAVRCGVVARRVDPFLLFLLSSPPLCPAPRAVCLSDIRVESESSLIVRSTRQYSTVLPPTEIQHCTTVTFPANRAQNTNRNTETEMQYSNAGLHAYHSRTKQPHPHHPPPARKSKSKRSPIRMDIQYSTV